MMRGCVLFLVLLVLVGCSNPPAPDDPWPECAEIRKQLQKESGEPSRLEVVEWVGRHRPNKPGPMPKPPTQEQLQKSPWALRDYEDTVKNRKNVVAEYESGIVYITVRYRDVNRFGAREIFTKTFPVMPPAYAR